MTGAPAIDFGGFGGWWVYEPSGIDTTQVTGWTRTDPTANGPRVVNNGTPGAPQTAFQGARYAVVPGAYQGLVGTLASTTGVGATYLLSAQIVSDASLGGTFELRLRNAGTGAESAPLTSGSALATNSWTLVAGTEVANAGYDRVVLRYSGGVGFASWLADDVHVCEVTGAPVNPPWWPLAGGAVLVTIVLFGGRRIWKSTRSSGAGSVGTSDPLPSAAGGGYDALTDGLPTASNTDALTDGLLILRTTAPKPPSGPPAILRYLFGLRGSPPSKVEAPRDASDGLPEAEVDALTDGILILRSTAPKPLTGPADALPSIEGNGTVDALTDGLPRTTAGPMAGPTVLNDMPGPLATAPRPGGDSGAQSFIVGPSVSENQVTATPSAGDDGAPGILYAGTGVADGTHAWSATSSGQDAAVTPSDTSTILNDDTAVSGKATPAANNTPKPDAT